MIFIIDNALSPVVKDQLIQAGYESIHVRDKGMQAANDEEIFTYFNSSEYVIISADTDFGTILALRQSSFPSVILFRQSATRSPIKQTSLLLSHLPKLIEDLEQGSVVVFDGQRIRVRKLPIIKPH